MADPAGHFDRETAVRRTGDGVFELTPSPAWNIGESANGGYVVSPVLRAMGEVADHPDPLAVTTHYLRPLRPDGATAQVHVEVLKAGRSTTVMRGMLATPDGDRCVVLATFGDLGSPASKASYDPIVPPMPDLPPPADCVHRSQLAQGVDLHILDRVEVRLDPACSTPGDRDDAVMQGWVRFVDDEPPSTRSLFLFADAFPPTLLPLFGPTGWVPTLELTVHARSRPASGWVAARFECDDLADGRLIESGTLWDATGALVARSRQLALILS